MNNERPAFALPFPRPLRRVCAFHAAVLSSVSLALLGLAAILTATVGSARAMTPESDQHSRTSLHGRDLENLLQGYALLQDLSNQESKVSQILIIRDGSPALQTLLRDISSDAQALRKDLDNFRHLDPNLRLIAQGLPEYEIAARRAITKETTNRVLYGKQPEFQLEMLVGQAAALSYGSNLMQVIIQRDDSQDRRTLLTEHQTAWKKLRQRVCDQIRGLPSPTP